MSSSTTTTTAFGISGSGYASATAAASKSAKGGMRSSPENVGPAPALKPKQSKSRNGCVTCKAKRLKCDESKPTCHQCRKRGVSCGGYKKDFKWRPFEEASLVGKPPKPARKSPGGAKSKRSSPTLSSPDCSEVPLNTSIGGPQPSPLESSFGSSSPSAYQSQYASSQSTPCALHREHSSMSQGGFDLAPAFLSPLGSPGQIPSPPASAQMGTSRSQPAGALPVPGSLDLTPTSPDNINVLGMLSEFGGASLDIANSLAPMNDLVPLASTSAPMQELMGIPSFGFVESLYPPTVGLQNVGSVLTFVKEEPEEDSGIEEIIRSDPNSQSGWVISARSPSPASSSSSRSSRGEGFVSISDIFRRPTVTATSQEMLVLHFDKHTCGIMSVKDGPDENPWRTLIWPLARDSPALYHAIASMTAFHMSVGRPELKMKGVEHRGYSVRYLGQGLASGGIQDDAALATTLVLAFSEAFDSHTKTGIEHLRGAKVFVNRALARHRASGSDEVSFKRLGFLYNVWVYLDVLTRLTTDEDGDYQGPGFAMHMPIKPKSEIDPLMGCATTLFPLIGNVASLVEKVRRTDRSTPRIMNQAMTIKNHLENWAPEDNYEPPTDAFSEVVHCVKTAEAYRYATLLYLHQAVPELPSPSSYNLAKKVLSLINEIPITSGSCIVHIYPLLAAGCEAITERERSIVKTRWEDMSSRMWIGNVSKAWEVMKEVWDRRDSFWESHETVRRYSSLSPIGTRFGSPTLDMPGHKRKTSPVEFGIEGEFCWRGGSLSENSGMGPKRRAMTDNASGRPSARTAARSSPTDILAEYEMSVRGKLHWVGVMKDWKWEVLLG